MHGIGECLARGGYAVYGLDYYEVHDRSDGLQGYVRRLLHHRHPVRLCHSDQTLLPASESMGLPQLPAAATAAPQRRT